MAILIQVIWFMILLICLILYFVMASEFRDAAALKGYEGGKYFWYCLLFPIGGYLLVIALPPKSSVEERRPAGDDLPDL